MLERDSPACCGAPAAWCCGTPVACCGTAAAAESCDARLLILVPTVRVRRCRRRQSSCEIRARAVEGPPCGFSARGWPSTCAGFRTAATVVAFDAARSETLSSSSSSRPCACDGARMSASRRCWLAGLLFTSLRKFQVWILTFDYETFANYLYLSFIHAHVSCPLDSRPRRAQEAKHSCTEHRDRQPRIGHRALCDVLRSVRSSPGRALFPHPALRSTVTFATWA